MASTTDVPSTDTSSTDTPAPAQPGPDQARDEVAELRERIDEIDDTLVALWRERADLSRQVGAARVAAGGTRLVLSREREILDRFQQELGSVGTQLGLLLLRAGRGPL